VTRVIAPGAALGVLGSGQLGRMFAIAARRMGYRVHTFSPEADTPTGQVADVEVVADYEDLDALRAFARQVDVVTFEFENVPIVAVDAIESITPVRPCGMALHTAQQRAREKQFLADRGFPTAPFGRAASLDELWDAVARIGTPAVIKTAAFGYDGKGTAQGDDAGRCRTHLDCDRSSGGSGREIRQPPDRSVGRRRTRYRRRDGALSTVREPPS
jgi:5-(carboxyamino)imidazole ribonucleotide synthase